MKTPNFPFNFFFPQRVTFGFIALGQDNVPRRALRHPRLHALHSGRVDHVRLLETTIRLREDQSGKHEADECERPERRKHQPDEHGLRHEPHHRLGRSSRHRLQVEKAKRHQTPSVEADRSLEHIPVQLSASLLQLVETKHAKQTNERGEQDQRQVRLPAVEFTHELYQLELQSRFAEPKCERERSECGPPERCERRRGQCERGGHVARERAASLRLQLHRGPHAAILRC